MGSIEGVYIGISRHILASGGLLSWWPAWYSGLPFQNTYPPLLHMLVAAASWLGHISPARAHHIVTALFFAFGPVTAYWAAARITGRRTESFFAALLYSVLAPSALLVPIIAQDIAGPFNSRRLQTLLVYGDGPHIAALALVPLAVFLVVIALEKRCSEWDFVAAMGIVAVVLTNWLGAFALATMLACYLVRRQDWIRVVGIGIFAYLIACPWLPPSTIAVVQFNAKTVGGDFRNTSLRTLVFLPCAAIGIFLLRRSSVFVKFGFLMAVLTLLSYWFHFDIVPQSHRYHLEMDLGLIFALVLAVAGFVPAKARVAVAAILLVFCTVQLWRLRYYARNLIQEIDITQRVEYKSAEWLNRNFPGQRVMVPGSISFWLNAFTEQPQLGGGFQNGNINFENRVATYFLGTGTEVPKLVLWLKAMGVEAVETTGPASEEKYKDFHNARVFDGALEQVWKSGDDTIFKVASEGLAHIMRKPDLVDNPPVNGLDVAEMERYVAAFGHPAKLSWAASNHAVFIAHLAPGDVISVQENFAPGWRAANAELSKDGLGFIAVTPKCTGDCRIELFYDGGLEMLIANWTSRAALMGGLIWIWISRRKRSLASLATQAI